MVAGVAIPAGATVVLDAIKGNRDPGLFGADPDAFDPDRAVDPSVARWGLSFGAGPHQCPGRSVAGGFPAPSPHEEADPEHIYGLAPLMFQAIAARGPRPGSRQRTHPRRPHRALHPLGDLPGDLLGLPAGVAAAPPRGQCAAAQSMRICADSSGACQK